MVAIQKFSSIAAPIIGFLFLWSAYSKIVAPLRLFEMVQRYDLAPAVLSLAVAFVLPYVELVSGISLICGFLRKGSAIFVLLLCTMFILAQISVMVRGMEVDCGCFGQNGQSVGWISLGKTTVVLFVSGIIFWSGSELHGMDRLEKHAG